MHNAMVSLPQFKRMDIRGIFIGVHHGSFVHTFLQSFS
jgi:hypothetical protein